MTTATVNEHGVDTSRLAEEIERWVAGPEGNTAALLAVRSGVRPEGIRQIRRGARPRCTLDWADRLTIAMNVPLNDVAPWPPPTSIRSSTSHTRAPRRSRRVR
jgi:hypothetical protein